MDAREKLNEFAELRGWDKNKLIGWSEAADFGEWLVKNCNIPHVSGSYSTVDKAKESGNKMDEMGKIFRKTKDGRQCYYSELSYFESNDL